ncbi:MAG: nucleoside kinase [Treponemataceae bacterium]|nr:nucleoside kinase [Treponemataceae bacterium]
MQDKLTFTFPDGTTCQAEAGIQALSLREHFSEPEERIFAVRVNNEVCPLDKKLECSARLAPVLDDTKDGSIVYRRSLCLLLAAAAHRLYPDARLLVGHSLGYGYYYTLNTGSPVEAEHVAALEAEMRRLVAQDLPILTTFIAYEEATALFESLGLTETRRQLNYIAPPVIRINTIDGFSDMYFGPLVPSTGLLKTFALMPYGGGFLLRFPKSHEPGVLPEFEDEPKLFNIYSRYKQWGKQLGVTSAASLNQLISERRADDFIAISETFQEKCIADIADQIASSRKVRVVLIAGPSSSGKTTTSKKLALELRAIGYMPKVISLDNYYVGRDRNPKDENGNYDYECLEALDIPLLNKNLIELFEGKEVSVPSYDFQAGVQFFEESNRMRLAENDILIMEGIHGLNDKLTPLIPSELKFKIYLSALTQLNLDDHNRISTSDNRLIRRLVRDAQFRGKSAADTIAMWPNVQKGERLHIFPFQNNADAILNTALDYELAVLKIFAEPLLRCVNPSREEYSEACMLLNFLNNFSPIPPTAVPSRSIIREFIGGSAFKY